MNIYGINDVVATVTLHYSPDLYRNGGAVPRTSVRG